MCSSVELSSRNHRLILAIMSHRLSIYTVLLIPVAFFAFFFLFSAHLLHLPTDYNIYISYLSSVHDYSSPFSPFLYRSNEFGWSFLVYIANLLAPSNYSLHLLIGVALAFLFYLIIFYASLYSLPDGLSNSRVRVYPQITLLVYLSTDIFILGLSNSLRTGISLLYFSLFVSLFILLSPLRFSGSSRFSGFFVFLSLFTSLIFHSASILFVILYFVFFLLRRLYLNFLAEILFKNRLSEYIFSTLYVFILYLLVHYGPLDSLYQYGQSSSSALGVFKFLFDLLLAISLVFLSRGRGLSEPVITLLFFSLSFSILGVIFNSIESFNRLEQFVRLVLLILSVNLVFSRVSRNSYLLLMLPLLIGSFIITFSSSAVRQNIFS